MSVKEWMCVGKIAQLKICKTLQAFVRGLCPWPEPAGGDDPGLGLSRESLELVWCWLSGQTLNLPPVKGSALHRLGSRTGADHFHLGKAWGFALGIHWDWRRDNALGGDKWKDILSQFLSVVEPGGGGFCISLHCSLAFLCLLLSVFISNRGKRNLCKIGRPSLAWRRRVIPGGPVSALQCLYLCWI